MSYLDLTQSFIEECNRTSSLQQLALLFGRFCKSLGCTHFVCLSHVSPLNPPEDAVVLTNYPIEWAKHHGANEYHTYDPIMATCKSSVQPFEWLNSNWRGSLTAEQESMLGEASEFKLVNGFTIPIHSSKGYPASLSVVFEKGELSPQVLASFHLLGHFVYEKALTMKAADVLPEQGQLTRKEIQVLQELSRGKSNWAISKIMNISENTVKKHVKNIYHKYGVATRPQAAIRGVFLGEINYYDVMSQKAPSDKTQSGFVHVQS